jgi:hypothetical protein
MIRPLFSLLALTALTAPALAQNPNDPGLLDPVIQELVGRTWRLPASHQVAGASEQINIVGRVKRKPANQSQSATGQPITNAGVSSPNRDLRDALRDLDDASANQQTGLMMTLAQEMRSIILGTTQGRIYDGFALLNSNRGGWLQDHIPGEYKAKRAEDRGHTALGLDGQTHTVWEVDVNLHYFDEEVDTDTYFLLIPPQADFRDMLLVHYTVYSTTTESFAPTTMLQDVDPFGAGILPSKGFDSAWKPLGTDQVTSLSMNHGPLGTIRGLQIWGWYAEPDRSVFIQPVWESLHPQTAAPQRDARGKVMMEQMASLSAADVGPAAPEVKVLTVVEAVMQGASPAQVQAMMNNPQVAPLGTHDQWHDVLSNRSIFPQEALDLLALEGIFPDVIGPNRLGPYDAILVYANHELYMDSLDLLEGHDPLTGWAVPLPHDVQNEKVLLKVINLDNTTHYLQSFDYGPALHDDIGTCSTAPSGGHSLEVFVDQPVQGAPKMAELQWRLGWGIRRGFGTLPQFDIFTQAADLAGLTSFQDEDSVTQSGWQYPAADRGNDWRILPPNSWLGGGAQQLQEGGVDGVIIGDATSGFGVAKMPLTDLAAYHPQGLVNVDTDGDGVNDALLFPAWLQNPNALQGDLIPATKLWEPFLYINPNDGSRFKNAANPSLGLWADLSFAFGEPLVTGANRSFEIRRPRSLGQALWHVDGLFRESTGVPSRTTDRFTR